MKILAIETSCDETSAAVVEKVDGQIIVRSNITATSLAIHAKTGGIIPENAAREQVKYIIPVIREAIIRSQFTVHSIDSIAVTYGPGLIGSLLVGVETAKTLSFVYKKPLIPVNHLLAHLFANFISQPKTYNLKPKTLPTFPFIGLIVSGGHTDLLHFKSIEDYKWLGGTRDDAAGEALDKIGRLLGLDYPAGAEIEKRAKLGSKTKIRFHSPLIGEETFDFSFSGLKTEAARFVAVNREPKTVNFPVNEICFAVQKAVIDVLVKKTLAAAEKYETRTILLGGGVAANSALREKLELEARSQLPEAVILSPAKEYCTDNAAMIGAYALLNPKGVSWKKVSANPELYFA